MITPNSQVMQLNFSVVFSENCVIGVNEHVVNVTRSFWP